MHETALYLPFNLLHALWFVNVTSRVGLLFFWQIRKEPTETRIPSKRFSSHHGRNWHFLNNILSGPPTGVPAKWTDSIVRFDSWQLSRDILKCDCVQSCTAFALAGIGLFSLLSLWSSTVSEQQLTVVCKARGENVRGHHSCHLLFFPVLGTGIRFFFCSYYSILWELCFFHCICGCCNIDFSWPHCAGCVSLMTSSVVWVEE